MSNIYKKKNAFLTITLLLLMILSSILLSACNSSKKPKKESLGLEYEMNDDGTCTITDIGTCTDTEVVIPEKIDNHVVTTIGEDSFFACSQLTSIWIPSSVKVIEYCAFSECMNLEKVTLADGLEVIEGEAFWGCEKLSEITIPKSVKEIGEWVFCKCFALESIQVSKGNHNYKVVEKCLIDIKNKAIIATAQAKKIPSDKSISQIGVGAFEYQQNIVEITVPSTITLIDDNAFFGCSNLKALTIPNTVKKIGNFAFSCTENLSITFQGTMRQWKEACDMESTQWTVNGLVVHCLDGDIFP